MLLETKENIKKLAHSQAQREICGLIVKKDDQEIVFPCRNSSFDNHTFKINETDYLRASLYGQISACFHSHVNNNPNYSIFDKINSFNHKIPFILYHLPRDKFYELNYKDSFGLVGRKFKMGESDCYTLVADYYRDELAINLPLFSSYNLEKWENEEVFKEEVEKAGFSVFTDLSELKEHDLILFNYYRTKMPPHFCVFLGNNFILHHPQESYSQINILSEQLLNKVIFCLRYNE